MALPAKPPHLHPEHTYIHISSPSPPAELSTVLPSLSGSHFRYIGMVGELKGEHIFEVVGPEGPMRRDSRQWKEMQEDVLRDVGAVEGVKSAKVLEMRQRAKRNEF